MIISTMKSMTLSCRMPMASDDAIVVVVAVAVGNRKIGDEQKLDLYEGHGNQ